MKGPDRDRLIKLYSMLGSDNLGERENTRDNNSWKFSVSTNELE